jgi:formate dehydrogenase major subunit
MAGLFLRLREMYKKDGGAFPDPILNLSWAYKLPHEPSPEELAKEYNGKALADQFDAKDPTKLVKKAGELLDGFAQLKDDGSTACGCWIFSGAWTEKGNMMARRDTADPWHNGQTLGWAFAWPANRRILYNRAAADPSGKPWDAKRKQVWWDAAQSKWVGSDVPDFKADSAPEDGMGPFIMNPEGVALLCPRHDERRPLPRALRALRDADRHQPHAPQQPQGHLQPGRAGLQGRHGSLRHRQGLPLRGHHLPAHRALPLLDQARRVERHHPARAVRRDRRGAGPRRASRPATRSR